jgi:hypothetical protein
MRALAGIKPFAFPSLLGELDRLLSRKMDRITGYEGSTGLALVSAALTRGPLVRNIIPSIREILLSCPSFK